VQDVCIVVCDGLKGLSNSVTAAWPLAVVQACVIHLLRNTFRLASRKDWDALSKDCARWTPPANSTSATSPASAPDYPKPSAAHPSNAAKPTTPPPGDETPTKP
jgi:putative transposase